MIDSHEAASLHDPPTLHRIPRSFACGERMLGRLNHRPIADEDARIDGVPRLQITRDRDDQTVRDSYLGRLRDVPVGGAGVDGDGE